MDQTVAARRERNPDHILADVVEQLRDIIWWNRRLTTLHEFVAADDLNQLLLDYDGPYLERIDPPDFFRDADARPISWDALADRCGIHPYVRRAVADALFDGNTAARLYHHQGECVEHLSWHATVGKTGRDLILSVPTSTGKTESIFIPVLDYCTHRRAQPTYDTRRPHTLKALIIYPMKALEVDQLNRFLRFLHLINERLHADGKAPLRIGLWDGDTPTQVGRDDAEGDIGRVALAEDPVRGLRCPVCRETLTYTRNDNVTECTHGHRFNWIGVTRASIVQGVDILITNPEAIEYLLLTPASGDAVLSSNEMKFIVIDEAHVWTGASGAAFSLLIARLRALYAHSQPHVTLASATIQNPKGFARSLLGDVRDEPITVTFVPRLRRPSVSRSVAYERIPITNLEAVLGTLLDLGTDAEPANLDPNAVAMLYVLGLSTRDGELTPDGRNLVQLAGGPSASTLLDSAEALLDSQQFVDAWAETLIERLPELTDLLFNGFGLQATFARRDTLTRYIELRSNVKDGAAILETLLSLGRGSGLVFDKYHYFLHTGQGLFYCRECGRIASTPRCPSSSAHGPVAELLFCRRCHAPAFVDEDGRLISLVSDTGSCRCGETLSLGNFDDAYVHYKTLASYMLGVAPPLIPSHKLLMFADGRELAETTADAAQTLDYPLIADRLILYLLLAQGAQPLSALTKGRGPLLNMLFHLYFHETPLATVRQHVQGAANVQQVLRDTVRAYQGAIYDLVRMRPRLFDSCLVSFALVDRLGTSPAERALVHAVLGEVIASGEEWIGDERVPARSASAMRRRIAEAPGFAPLIANGFYDRLLAVLKEEGVVVERERVIRNRPQTYIAVTGECEQRLFLSVPAQVAYCEQCHHGFPDVRLTRCPYCSSERVARGARYDSATWIGGYLPNTDARVPRVLDHWAKDLLVPALALARAYPTVDSETPAIIAGLPHSVIWSHGGRTPQVLRGAIEDGFKRTSPTVNAVACTPTMELGIDIGTLDCVVQIGIPPTRTNYIQRVGRTGRNRLVPSLVITIVRNGNAIDGYFYGNLLRGFLARPLQELKIPQPSDRMVAQHVCAEVARYLGQSPRSAYRNYYTVFAPDAVVQAGKQQPHWLFAELAKRLYTFGKDVVAHWSELIPHLQRVFTPLMPDFDAARALAAIFVGERAFLIERFYNLFSGIEQFYIENRDPAVLRGVAEQLPVLSRVLDLFGLFPTFRGSGGSVPIIGINPQNKQEVELALQSAAYAVRENYPGPFEEGQPKSGALWHVAAKPYQISKVYVRTPAISTEQPLKRCTNAECAFAYELYQGNDECCPFCNESLAPIELYEYWYGEARRYRAGRARILETTPRIVSFIEEA